MALTLGNPTLEDPTREDMADAIIAFAGASAEIRLVDSAGPTTLVAFGLDNPIGTSTNGVITVTSTPITATASAGSATTPDTWELRTGGGALVMSGPVTGTGPITSGENVSLDSMTITVPAS